MRVAVLVASKHGATREIGEAIAVELRAAGHDARAEDAAAAGAADLEAGAVVLGSAVYAGHWLKPAAELLDRHAEALAGRPLWLFSSGPVGEPPQPEDAAPEGIAEALERTGARGHEVFPGRLDRELLTRPERLVVRALRAPEGDFRDWEAIGAWGRTIAAELSA